ncbi:MAG: hypothetical protein ACYSU0_12810, partial [Planctomycetota bacterium]
MTAEAAMSEEGTPVHEAAPAAGSGARVRFPWVALALCVLSVGAAAWLWMRYSYCWDVTPDDLCKESTRGRYVRLRSTGASDWSFDAGRGGRVVLVEPPDCNVCVFVRVPDAFKCDEAGAAAFRGRAGRRSDEGRPVTGRMELDATRGRFHPASIAGLVVGAWGVFIFASAL